MYLLLTVVLSLQTPSIDDLVRRLGSDRIEDRNAAAQELRKLGKAVIPALERAAKDADSERAAQAGQLLDELNDPLRGETAEETIRRFQERLAQAKTLSVKIRNGFEHGDRKSDHEKRPPITLMIKMPDKVFQANEQDPSRTGAVSDGKQVLGSPAYHPQDFVSDLLTGFRKAGLGASLYAGGVLRMTAKEIVRARLEESTEITDIALFGNDGLGRIITYTLKMEHAEPMDVRLWCDRQSRLPRRRIVSSRGEGNNRQSFIDEYEDWTLDAEIPDEKFAIPAAK